MRRRKLAIIAKEAIANPRFGLMTAQDKPTLDFPQG
jgi:hypothetical protein